jgi:multidrug transporter EmrE-like cation transporter
MNGSTLALLLFSVVLSTGAQILLKVGMTPANKGADAGVGLSAALLNAALSPWVIGGLSAYVASAVVWLFVLSKVDVSRAYPCVALGFALTAMAGHFLLGEPVSAARIIGIGIIVAGVVLVAVS